MAYFCRKKSFSADSASDIGPPTVLYLRLRHKIERQLVAVRVHTVALQVIGAVQRALLGARHGVGTQRRVPVRAEVTVVVLLFATKLSGAV